MFPTDTINIPKANLLTITIYYVDRPLDNSTISPIIKI